MAKRNVQLTEETVSPGTARKALITLFLTALVVLAVDWAAHLALAEYTTNRGYWLIHKKWKLIERRSKPVDWVFLGDSACNQGVRPDVFDPKVGGSSMNLCTIGAMLVLTDAWMLETYLQRWGKPKGGVVLVHVYDVWHRGLSSQFKESLIGKIPLGWGFWNRLKPPVTLDSKQQKDLFVARYTPLYSENKTLAEWIMSPSKPFKTGFYLDPQGYMPNELSNPSGVRSDMQGHVSFTKHARFAFSKVNQDALDRIRQLADEKDFEVYIASSPVYKGLYDNDDFQAYYGHAQEAIRRFVATSPHLHYVLQDPVTFSEREMENADHLTHKPAGVYTDKLADAIREARANAPLTE